ncbi:VOC family protein [Kribbella sp. NBC_01505]|uniref:VOC family protein n=1 Tax=Kribbella sp. NBC_01505 TaxID=2903580 RepID=UPI003865BA24
MSNLENLRKQAKLYVRWHRAGYHPVAAQIRATLPRFEHLTDRQVLEGSFKLSDAQELVAREHGFESWPALRTGVHVTTVNNTSTPPATVLGAVEAQLFVADLDVACEFYVAKLGFALAFTYGEPAFYGQVRRDEVGLNLRHVDEPVFVGDIRERDHLLSASINLGSSAETRQLYLEYEAAGVEFHQTLRKEPWGARTFIVRDPDGNLVLFAGPATDAS